MARAIDADALQELCNKRIQDIWNSGVAPVSWAEAYADFKDDIDSIPTLTPQNEWISVDERLPEPKHNVLAYSTRSGIAEADYADGVWMQYRWSAVMDGVTHWMPLPAPPVKDENNT